MLDHDPKHKMRMIPSGQWEGFLEDLAQTQQGKTIHIEQGEVTRQVILERSNITLLCWVAMK